MASQVLAAAECVPQVVQVGDKPSLQEEFMDFCTSPLPRKVTAITEVDKYWHAISQIKDYLKTEYRYSTLAKLAKATLLYPMAMLIPNVYSATLVSTKRSTETD